MVSTRSLECSDITVGICTPPTAPSHEGSVTFTGHDGSGGLGVVIRTKEPCVYQNGTAYYKTIYWHLKEGTIRVKPDQEVVAGTIIALADNTGMSTGSHLHFGLKPMTQGEQAWQWANIEQNNGYQGAIDPTIYFTGEYADVVYPGLPARAFQALLEFVRNKKI